MIRKRILASLLALSVMITLFPVHSAGAVKTTSKDPNVAEALLNDKTQISGFSVVEMGTVKDANIVYK